MTDQQRINHKKYRQTEKGKATSKKALRKYWKSEKGKATRNRYWQSAKGKAMRIKIRGKYKKPKEKANAYHRERRKRDPNYRFKVNLRSAVGKVLSRENARRCARTVALLGCSIENFKIHLESQFEPGMTWENHGTVWEKDHIVPCALFDLTKPEHQRRCFHFSNYQPMFIRDNRCKAIRSDNQFRLL